MPTSEVAKEQDENAHVRRHLYELLVPLSVLLAETLTGFVLDYSCKDVCIITTFGK